MVGHPPKTEISRKHAKQIEHDQQRGRTHDSKPASTALDRQRKIRRNPRKQSPPPKQPKKIEQQQRNRAFPIRCPKNCKERFIPLCPQCPPWFKLLILPCAPMIDPHLRLRHTLPYPKRDERRQNPNKEHKPPIRIPQNNPRHQRRQRIPDSPRTLHDGNRLGPQFIRPGFRHQRRPGIPLAAHPQSEDEPKHGQHKHGCREPGSKRADRVSQNAEHQCPLASNSVGKKTKKHAADARRQQRERVKKSRRFLRHPQIAHDVSQHQRVKHGVKSVQHPAKRGR